MDKNLLSVSMNGRMAYTIMCVEVFLKNLYPDRDWSIISRVMWEATSTNWGDWPYKFSSYIPDVLLEYDEYADDLAESFSESDYHQLIALYKGITEGSEDDPRDEVNYMLNLPYEMAMVYEGTIIGDGKESLDIIARAEAVLLEHNLPLPDYHSVLFSSAQELNGWGKDFDGTRLSIIL